jgi:uncharacterized membrane protein YgdD (TMEM256/DUF423 family)
MTLYNRYLVILASLFSLSTVVLAAYGVNRLDAYFTVYVLEYMVTTLLFVSLDPRARRLLDTAGYVLFAGFLVIVAVKVYAILRGT